jgi:hypothetical protein
MHAFTQYYMRFSFRDAGPFAYRTLSSPLIFSCKMIGLTELVYLLLLVSHE